MYAPRRTVVIILRMCIVSCCYYYFSVNFFIFFFVSFRSEFFQPRTEIGRAFPPRRRGVARKPRTRHICLSLGRPCGCPGPADSSRSYSTYVPRGDRILNTHTHTLTLTSIIMQTYKYTRNFICTRHCFVIDDVRNSRATVHCVRRATLARRLTTDSVSPNDVRRV